jgi:SAM-dependent methyltransferase
VVALLAPRPGERILDLGCGDGALTQTLAALGCTVTGVDASPELVEAARRRGLDARLMDGHALTFDGEFDAVFSNAALHWMQRPERVIDGVWRALRSGGRFVGEFGARDNARTVERALESALRRRGVDPAELNPWFFPDEATYERLLDARGFAVDDIRRFPRPTLLPSDLSDWLRTFAGAFTRALSQADRGAFIAEVREALRPVLCGDEERWTVDYVRLRFAARRPG